MSEVKNLLMRKFHALMRDTNTVPQKEAWLEGYGVEHTNELGIAELKDLISRLIELRDGTNSRLRAVRSEALTLLQKLDVYKNNNSWAAVNEYLMNPRIAGKRLYEMSYDEVVQLCPKLRSILAKKTITDKETKRLTEQN